MSEFGYKYDDPEIGAFYSRLSPDRLEKLDRQRGKDFGTILNRTVEMEYNLFLQEYSPLSHPFLHEVRVHVFRRDKYYKEARAAKNPEKKREKFFVAFKENLILEKYFNQTISNSVYGWSPERAQKLKARIDKSRFYESPVSAGLFTSFYLKTMWIVILAFLLAIGVLNFALWRRPENR